ncbi:MAG: XdhC family protein [Pirellulales bacterium]|nr:XdhC family protein [Pirellulales bacterium]
MREILPQLAAYLKEDRPLAYCRLVETRGSTPQKAGAAMLVFPDGSQAGTIGGGCVEAEVKRKALRIINDGIAEIVCFQLDSDYGWDDGLICGGRMQVLIDPIVGAQAKAYYETLGVRIAEGKDCQEAISLDLEKSGLPETACLLLDEHANVLQTLRLETANSALVEPDGHATQQLRAQLSTLKDRPRPQAAGGFAYLSVLKRCRLVIVGGGHVGKAVAAMAADMDFDTCVIDDRPEVVSAERFPRANQRLSGPMEDVLRNVEITPDTYCLIVTRGHNHDEQALYHLCQRGARYVGMIGSKRKIKLIYDDLLREGVPSEVLQGVHAPVGIDIGSQTVPEIAVSIMAELIAHRNLGGRVPGSASRQGRDGGRSVKGNSPDQDSTRQCTIDQVNS